MPSTGDDITQIPQQPGRTVGDYRALLLSDTPLLDVRAPVEFDKGAFPTSINLPLMNDEERHQVGIRYRQSGQQSAIALGAVLVSTELRAQRVAAWAQFAAQNPHGALYCFRGGLRSRIAQHWLTESGVDLPMIEGGYKALRTFLMKSLASLCQAMNLTLIGGRTGNGKTLLIRQLGDSVDLEALASHRGSSFGSLGVEQPRNIDFENAVTIELMKLEDAGIAHVYLEDEARLIGRVCVPDTLRNAMQRAPIVILECDMQQRIVNCFDDYVPDLLGRYQHLHGEEAGFVAYADHHRNSLARIRKRFGGENYHRAMTLLNRALTLHREHGETCAYAEFIELLLRDYYDPMYDYQLRSKYHRVTFTGPADELIDWIKNQ
ncbi:MAG: tRNA 2-selenouridine(34) synthase MnmH [Granulosicoccus sp.]|nr:tRNA 2-selenouridine(34) synthase MnmH [Granulosicoccus sp.]